MTKRDADKAPEAAVLETANDNDTDTDQSAKELTVRLSRSLYGKLLESAHDEGIGVEELAKEILAEGVSLRIWDILERRSRTREGEMLRQQPQRSQQGSGNPGNQINQGNQGNQGNPGNHRGGQNRGGHGPNKNNRNDRRQERYNNILNDGPTFLEDVRQLDKKR
jgi:hypothetical protein